MVPKTILIYNSLANYDNNNVSHFIFILIIINIVVIIIVVVILLLDIIGKQTRMYGTKSNRMIKIRAIMPILYSKIIPEKTDHINTDENDDNNN